MLEGEVDDYYGEFFVLAQPVKAEALWREGYQLQKTMLPSFIPEPLAHRILRTGKSINFLRVCCSDQGWAQAASEAVKATGASANGGSLGYGETEVLEALVSEAAGRIDRHLIQIMYNRYDALLLEAVILVDLLFSLYNFPQVLSFCMFLHLVVCGVGLSSSSHFTSSLC